MLERARAAGAGEEGGWEAGGCSLPSTAPTWMPLLVGSLDSITGTQDNRTWGMLRHRGSLLATLIPEPKPGPGTQEGFERAGGLKERQINSLGDTHQMT